MEVRLNLLKLKGGVYMELFKITFNLVILLSTSMIGFLYSGIFNKRAKNLLDLEYCLRILQSEIIAGNAPLPIALENTYKKGKGQIASIFKIIRDDLIEEKRDDVYHSFLILEDILFNRYLLEKEDINVLLFLGEVLGKTNRVDQENNFIFIIEQIEKLSTQAELEKVKNKKLYPKLGVLVGLGIIIIFI